MLFRPQGLIPEQRRQARDREGVRDEPLMDVRQRRKRAGVSDSCSSRGLRKEFGGLVAVNDVDLTIPRGSIVSLIGPNGAGQDDVLQHDHRRLQADGRAGGLRRQGHRRLASAYRHRARHRADVPEHPPLPADDVRSRTCSSACTAGFKGGIVGSILGRRGCGARSVRRTSGRASCSSTAGSRA